MGLPFQSFPLRLANNLSQFRSFRSKNRIFFSNFFLSMQNECDEKKWSSLTGALNVSRSIKVNNYCFLVADDVTGDHGPISGHFFLVYGQKKENTREKKIRARRAQKSRDWQRKRCLEPIVPFFLFQVSKN